MSTSTEATVSVVVVTYLRATVLARCLSALHDQSHPAHEIIIVDASPDLASARVVAQWPEVRYIRNSSGAGNMTNSRNCALNYVTGSIIAFLDDDAIPERRYLEAIAATYADPSVGMSCSRTLNGVVGEDADGVYAIGTIAANGDLHGYFAADPAADVDIQHGIGATMTFRREILCRLGGFREDFAGVSGVREDADAFLRARALGYRAVFVHKAIANHLAAPQARGQRFDAAYDHCRSRNHIVLLCNNFGLLAPMTRSGIRSGLVNSLRTQSQSRPRYLVRVAAQMSGIASGTWKGYHLNGLRARRPERTDPTAERLRLWLGEPSESPS